MPINTVRNHCMRCQGDWIHFRTQWGMHQGIVERVEPNRVLVRVPRQYAPATLAAAQIQQEPDAEKRLDLALAAWGGPGYGYRGYRGYGAYGNGWWGGGWWWWWLAFAAIFWLAFLW